MRNINNHPNNATASSYFFSRPMPAGLEGLTDLALDLRWTWSHFSDRLWERLDPEGWKQTGNPYFILQNVSKTRLEEAARDQAFQVDLLQWMEQRQEYLDDSGGSAGPMPQTGSMALPTSAWSSD